MSGQSTDTIKLERLDGFRWRIPKEIDPAMRVDGIVYSSPDLIGSVESDASLRQVANVAMLPGIVGASLAMPDIHWGYGFPIGGVAAFDSANGIISPGGVGYDINCGVNLTRTRLSIDEIRDKLPLLADMLFAGVPCGVGVGGDLNLSPKEVCRVAELGAEWAVKKGLAGPGDLERMEEGGRMEAADPGAVSRRAVERGRNQLGTLGSGNHFVEVQVVEEIFDRKAAAVLGLEVGMITVMIHSGSRGFGYQVCEDSLKTMGTVASRYGISLPDRQLACAPLDSKEGRSYFSAMAAAANFAWANRIILVDRVRRVFERTFGRGVEALGMGLVFDVSHNIARFETHLAAGEERRLCVHRKGATRSFAPGDPRVPGVYRSIGQPVLIPGDMGTSSYVLVGTDSAMEQTFGSTCHGAGRLLSRRAAVKTTRGRNLAEELRKSGVLVRSRGKRTLAEEAPEAYKDVDSVVKAAAGAGIAKLVARMRPVVVVKG